MSCKTETPDDELPPLAPIEQKVSSTTDGEWTPTGRMALGRLLHTAVSLPDGRVLATGGYNRSAELYNPIAGTWSPTASTLNTRRGATSTLLNNGKALVAGVGGPEWNSGITAELYDPSTGTWTATGNLGTARLYHTATLLQDGRVLVTGGSTGEYSGNVLGSAELYDPDAGTWAFTGSMAIPRRNHTATLLADGRVLVTGGIGGINSAEVYDPATGSWSQVASMAFSRAHHAAALLNDGKVLVSGGGSSDWSNSASAEVFDPATGIWAPAASMAMPRRHHSATTLPSGKVLVAGGYHEYTGILFSSELYDPATNSWVSAGSMDTGRYSHTATLLAGGRLLVVGGFSNGDQASAELYTSFHSPPPGPPEGPTTEPEGTSLLVQVVSTGGAPIAGATVKLGTTELTTSEAGNALFENLSAGAFIGQVNAPGFAPATVTGDLEAGVNGGTMATLMPLSPPIPFSADTGATVGSGATKVTIPASSLVDENGQPVTGTVEVVFASIDPTTDDLLAAPGPMVGIASSGEEAGLESGFMAEISLMQNGRPLKLAPGATATIRFTLPPDFAATVAPGDEIPAWWFDLEAGVWREDGFGIVEESPDEPGKLIWTAQVTHFTWWNCDKPWYTRSCVNVLVTNQFGSPLSGRWVYGRGVNYWYSTWGYTNSAGRTCLRAMRGGTIRVSTGPASANVTPWFITSCGSSLCAPVTLTVPTSDCGPAGATQTCSYTGPPGTNGVGVCRAGTRVCNGFTWGPCMGQVTPSAEACDGKDNNCNGKVDIDVQGYGDACTSTNPGICQPGTRLCSGGQLSCISNVQPNTQQETCDGQDNDCDSQTDESPVDVGGVCTSTNPGICSPGTWICGPNGQRTCRSNVQPGTQQEICDGQDNDCDTQTDENPVDVGGVCTSSNKGICQPGTWICNSNGQRTCRSNVQPNTQPEICDGLDNDCNGLTDDNASDAGGACTTPHPGICAPGTWVCGPNGQRTCQPLIQPGTQPEVCDGLDNNCDGQLDNSPVDVGGACTSNNPGICQPGTWICEPNGQRTCRSNIQPGTQAEICDGLDNDCDTQTDENIPNGGACDTQIPGVCSAGVLVCKQGGFICEPTISATPELCDGLNNDCDEEGADEGNPEGGGPCSIEGAMGVCAVGTLTCTNGGLACIANTGASAEVCDGLDNDCDGTSDEEVQEVGQACTVTGKQGICSTGTYSCTAGSLVCNQTQQPLPNEICNGLDDDCDGSVDEGISVVSCETGLPGVCAQGVTACSGGNTVCNPKVPSSDEVCDGKDNDCDGQTDEDLPPNSCGGSFDFDTVDTNYAQQNTMNHDITLIEGQTIQIGTCSLLGSTATGDTFLRLFRGTTEVAWNDDSPGCGSASFITYTVPQGAAGTYTIKAGCFSSQPCSGTVVYR